jgi:hypothetical protein
MYEESNEVVVKCRTLGISLSSLTSSRGHRKHCPILIYYRYIFLELLITDSILAFYWVEVEAEVKAYSMICECPRIFSVQAFLSKMQSWLRTVPTTPRVSAFLFACRSAHADFPFFHSIL